MQRFTFLALIAILLFGLTGFETSANNQVNETLDLANVPLAVHELPEEGYQVMSGDYLKSDEVVNFIASPRNLSTEGVQARLDGSPVSNAYVLNLVLPEDRAWQDSPPLALLQTTVYLVDENSTDSVMDVLLDHSNIEYLEVLDPAIEGGTTAHWIGESGEQLRTVAQQGDVVLEIVSLDVTGRPNGTEHSLVVEGTLDRLERVRADQSIGLSTMSLKLASGEEVADFFNAQQSGVHGVYRMREGALQPAIGELGADAMGVSPLITSMYFSHDLVQTAGGTSSISVMLYEFENAESAEVGYEALLSNSPESQLVDPYYTIGADEAWTDQGVLGLYRVTGTLSNNNYSGYVEIRVQGNVVAAIGHRSIGTSLPDAAVTSGLMDHQLGCIQMQSVCAPYEFGEQMPPIQATPIATEESLGSAEFGWNLPELGSDWIVDEQFSESGYDRIGLRNGVSIFEFESVINHHGEPLQCVLDELDLLEEFEEHSVITVWEDADGNTDGGNTENQAWITYRVEPLAEERADQEYVIRIDCFALVPDGANLVMRHIAPVDYWIEEKPKGESLRDSITLPESSGQRGKLAASAHDWRTTMIISHIHDRAA